MVKQRIHDPKTGKITWVERGDLAPPNQADAPSDAPTSPAPARPRARRGATPTAPKEPPKPKKSEWDSLFDGMNEG